MKTSNTYYTFIGLHAHAFKNLQLGEMLVAFQ
jgi:hypothetical protein